MGFGLNYAGREPTNPTAARRVAPITKSTNEFLTVLNQNNLGVRSVCLVSALKAKLSYTPDRDRGHPPIIKHLDVMDRLDRGLTNSQIAN
jgi:hypothetical protein